MGQESFIYSFVARGTMVLAEYTEFTGNFPAIAAQCLQKLPSSNNKFTYNCDHHTFNFLVQDGYAYCVVSKESVGKQISIAFLERVRADFNKRYGGGKADTAVAKSLNKEFGPIMKEHMQYIIDHADEIEKLLKVKAQVSEVKSIMLENIDKISIAFLERVRADFNKRYGGGKADTAVAKSLNKEFGPIMKEHMQYIIDHADEIEKLLKVKAQVSEVKSIMLENIDKAIERGENLTILSGKTENLRDSALEFKTKGTQIRRKMWYQNMKIKLVVFGIILFLVLIIWLSICRGFNCTN
uniref:Vesicle-associated membrane protein 724 n=1 Tax=Solanum tuberosum TaxID=4113 RepID=M1ASU4_SOLTU